MTSPPSPLPNPKRPLTGFAREELAGIIRWFRRSASRQNLMAAVKTLAWLAPLTLLIWVYAEREQIIETQPPGESIPIAVRSSDPNRFVELRLEKRDFSVMAQLRGPRSRIDEVREQVNPQGDRPSVVITIPQDLSPGVEHELDTAELLSSTQVFADSGVTIFGCRPARLPVFVDEIIEQEVDVEARPDVTNLVRPPIFDPPRITIRAPKHLFAEAKRMGLLVYADLAGSGVLDKPGPQEATVRVLARGMPRENVVYTPATVKATLEVRQADQPGKISSVSVYAFGPRFLLARYRVECKDTLPNVPVIGPPDQVASLEQENMEKPVAVLKISLADLPAGTLRTGRLQFEFPKGAENVRVSPEFAQQSFEYTLIEQTTDQ